MNTKKLKTTILPLLLLIIGCNSTNTPVETTINGSPKLVNTSASVTPTSSPVNVTETLPETSNSGSLEDKYNLNDYIQNNNILSSIPYSAVDKYKVRFTSDGGPIFSIKATTDSTNMDLLWKKTPSKLLFDTFQLLNIAQSTENTKYYSRYSQLIETNINVTDSTNKTLDKTVNLVQTVSLSMNKINNGYKISTFTPVTVRQVEKNETPYKIDKVILGYGSESLTIDADKTLIPWPGISVNGSTKGSVRVFISSAATNTAEIAALISIGTSQTQLTKNADGSYSGDFDLPAFQTEKNSLVIELIDKISLSENEKFHGYTWIIPFVK